MPATIDAYSIWLHARSAVTSARYPSRLAYTIAVSGFDGEKPVADHYRATADPGDGAIRIFPISDEQLAKPPPVPHGVNLNIVLELCIAKSGCTSKQIPAGHPAPYQDLLGEPLLEPTYMFGLRYKAARSTPTSPQADGSLRVIAIVSSGSPDYKVSLIDTPLLDGVPTYHLGLTPLRKPKDNRLRELWIDTNDYLLTEKGDRRGKLHAGPTRGRTVDGRFLDTRRRSVHHARKHRRYSLLASSSRSPECDDCV
ncbi:MAG: hypothetical protein WAK11_14575 [Candidatus Cybelea sp.]